MCADARLSRWLLLVRRASIVRCPIPFLVWIHNTSISSWDTYPVYATLTERGAMVGGGYMYLMLFEINLKEINWKRDILRRGLSNKKNVTQIHECLPFLGPLAAGVRTTCPKSFCQKENLSLDTLAIVPAVEWKPPSGWLVYVGLNRACMENRHLSFSIFPSTASF